ncbi:MAG: DNA repair protein RecO [Pseudomonadales bacterium]|nr:DNA repair protein RecO [Pseudomonadales bacterium]
MQQDNAYLLHIKPYRESSALVRVLSAQHGLVAGVLKGVYKKDKHAAARRAALQMGNCIEISWLGKRDLKTFIQVDALSYFPATDTRLFLCLSYINELLLRFMQEGLPANAIFQRYQLLLNNLSSSDLPKVLLEANLRAYEFDLLELLGFALDFSVDAYLHDAVICSEYYRVIAGVGVMRLKERDYSAFSGKALQDINARDFSDPKSLRQAKLISRYLLNFHLEGRPLKTRQLYREMMV